MGAGGSTRRLSLRNEEPHIIEVTNDVISRLKTGMERSTPPSASAAQTQSQSQDTGAAQPSISPSQALGSQEQVVLGVGTRGQHVLETVSALQVRKQKDEELHANDFFWRSKLRELEARYVSSAFASEKEFNKELEKLKTLIPKKREDGCKDKSVKVAECYATHPTQTLRCSQLVKEFAQCVETMNLPSRSAA